MAFECVVTYAVLTRRTLVLPAPQPWYLLDYQDSSSIDQSKTSEFAEIFDIDALKTQLNVISTDQFLRSNFAKTTIPAQIRNSVHQKDLVGRFTGHGWIHPLFEWLRSSATMPRWNPLQTCYCHPSADAVTAVSLESDSPFFGKLPVENSAKFVAEPVLHFPASNPDNLRSFGQATRMVSFASTEQTIFHRRLIRAGIRYRKEILDTARAAIKPLGEFDYDAIHIRSNDFSKQFDSAVPKNINVLKRKMHKLLDGSDVVYLSTDDPDTAKFSKLIPGRRIVTLSDLMNSQSKRSDAIPSKLYGPIEQVVCAFANRFVGTKYSTFSQYITRLRIFFENPNAEILWHTDDEAELQDWAKEEPCRWRQS